jgi:hypothetical protein
MSCPVGKSTQRELSATEVIPESPCWTICLSRDNSTAQNWHRFAESTHYRTVVQRDYRLSRGTFEAALQAEILGGRWLLI